MTFKILLLLFVLRAPLTLAGPFCDFVDPSNQHARLTPEIREALKDKISIIDEALITGETSRLAFPNGLTLKGKEYQLEIILTGEPSPLPVRIYEGLGKIIFLVPTQGSNPFAVPKPILEEEVASPPASSPPALRGGRTPEKRVIDSQNEGFRRLLEEINQHRNFSPRFMKKIRDPKGVSPFQRLGERYRTLRVALTHPFHSAKTWKAYANNIGLSTEELHRLESGDKGIISDYDLMNKIRNNIRKYVEHQDSDLVRNGETNGKLKTQTEGTNGVAVTKTMPPAPIDRSILDVPQVTEETIKENVPPSSEETPLKKVLQALAQLKPADGSDVKIAVIVSEEQSSAARLKALQELLGVEPEVLRQILGVGNLAPVNKIDASRIEKITVALENYFKKLSTTPDYNPIAARHEQLNAVFDAIMARDPYFKEILSPLKLQTSSDAIAQKLRMICDILFRGNPASWDASLSFQFKKLNTVGTNDIRYAIADKQPLSIAQFEQAITHALEKAKRFLLTKVPLPKFDPLIARTELTILLARVTKQSPDSLGEHLSIGELFSFLRATKMETIAGFVQRMEQVGGTKISAERLQDLEDNKDLPTVGEYHVVRKIFQ